MFDSIDSNPSFHYQFLMGLTRYIGFSPDLSNSEFHFFNLESGCYESAHSSRYSISGNKLKLFKTTLGMEFDKSKGELLNGSQKQELLEMILLYFKLHLQGFKSPKSLDVLNQVFN
jgi:DNA repair protein RecO (recombination protein O)